MSYSEDMLLLWCLYSCLLTCWNRELQKEHMTCLWLCCSRHCYWFRVWLLVVHCLGCWSSYGSCFASLRPVVANSWLFWPRQKIVVASSIMVQSISLSSCSQCCQQGPGTSKEALWRMGMLSQLLRITTAWICQGLLVRHFAFLQGDNIQPILGCRLLGWWSIDKTSREEHARLFQTDSTRYWTILITLCLLKWSAADSVDFLDFLLNDRW